MCFTILLRILPVPSLKFRDCLELGSTAIANTTWGKVVNGGTSSRFRVVTKFSFQCLLYRATLSIAAAAAQSVILTPVLLYFMPFLISYAGGFKSLPEYMM